VNAEVERKEYARYAQERDALTTAIIDSTASKIVVVAGPGTGKSYLFQQLCMKSKERGDGEILALSFINELVDDLAKDLYGLAKVKTLHSYALSRVPGNKKMYLRLSNVVERDYKIISDAEADYNDIFCNLLDAEPELTFYSQRRKYYDFFSPHCSVYTLIKIFENDENRIPEYARILIDEYQDFNKLESRLLSLLSNKSPVVIVGDDDQSLYSFKYAVPADIRSKHSSDEYESHELPYCSRCTKVVIDAFDHIIRTARGQGYLGDRVSKQYLYFPCEAKDLLSAANPHILVKRNVYPNVIAYNIDKDIQDNVDPRAGRLPSILIVCPLRKQIDAIEKKLRARGYANINARHSYERNSVLELFNLLLKDNSSNLAWRLLFEAECTRLNKVSRFEEVVRLSNDSDDPFKDLLEVSERRTIRHVNAALRKIRDGQEVADDRIAEVFEVLGCDPIELSVSDIRKQLQQDAVPPNTYKSVPIKIVTILGSKGLTYDYTYLVNFDDRYLLDRSPEGSFIVSDSSICKFLVALTRSRERVSVFTAKSELPQYVQWIDNVCIRDSTDE